AREHRVVARPQLRGQGVPLAHGTREPRLRVVVRATLRGAVDEVLRRHARDVDAAAAVAIARAFYDRDRGARASEGRREGLAALAPADHQHLDVQLVHDARLPAVPCGIRIPRGLALTARRPTSGPVAPRRHW